jgi:hypothetical protein
LSHSDYGWCGPPTCLLSARAPVETGTPPLHLDYATRWEVSNQTAESAGSRQSPLGSRTGPYPPLASFVAREGGGTRDSDGKMSSSGERKAKPAGEVRNSTRTRFALEFSCTLATYSLHFADRFTGNGPKKKEILPILPARGKPPFHDGHFRPWLGGRSRLHDVRHWGRLATLRPPPGQGRRDFHRQTSTSARDHRSASWLQGSPLQRVPRPARRSDSRVLRLILPRLCRNLGFPRVLTGV